jgi:hypothetical protein
MPIAGVEFQIPGKFTISDLIVLPHDFEVRKRGRDR